MAANGSVGGASAPPYPHRHSGAVLVCGNAFCLHDDLERARRIIPNAPVIAVNGAAGEIDAFALFSQHPRKFEPWIAVQRERFGDDFTTHSAGNPKVFTRNSKNMPWVDYWWDRAAGGGTSTWGARKLAVFMGFDLVLLCGMPLEKGGYANGRMAKAFQKDDLLEHYRSMIRRDVDWHDGVRSMSGWTMRFLGHP